MCTVLPELLCLPIYKRHNLIEGAHVRRKAQAKEVPKPVVV